MAHREGTDRSIPWIARMLLDTGPAGVALLEGPEFVCTYVNASYQAIAPTRPMLGRPVAQAWPEIAVQILPVLRQARETGEPSEAREWRLDIVRNGLPESAWFSFRFHPLPSRPGEPAAVAVHVLDRTGAVLARKREEELRAEREKLLEVERTARAAEQLSEVIPQIVWTTDAGGRADWCNRHFTEYTGLDAGAATGAGWQRALHPDDAARAAARWAASIASGEPYELEHRLRRADGAYRWHLTRAVPLRASDGRVLRWFGTSTDIDDQKRAQEEIQTARGRAEDAAQVAAARAAELNAVLDSIADGLILYDREGRIVRANAAAERFFGFTEADRDVTPAERLRRYRAYDLGGRIVSAESLPPVRALRGEEVRNVEIRLERDGAPPTWVSLSAAPIRTVEGDLQGAVTTIADVTANHAMQEQRDDMLRTISHDLRTPLTVVVAQAQMLERRPEDREAIVRRAGSIRTSAARMASMIEDLVDVVRLEAGHVRIEPRPVELRPFAQELRERLRGAVAVERLRLDLPEGLPPALADPPRLERILVNLITNALKYSPADAEAVLSAEERDGQVRISVRDRGAGIAPDELPRLFQRFYRSPAATRQEGLGLGLYITRLLVEAQGGRIAAESEPGRGSVFHVTLPASPAGAAR
jgi:PAS domain S-box-containing protein